MAMSIYIAARIRVNLFRPAGKICSDLVILSYVSKLNKIKIC
jgi:hypothetical protein